MDIENPKTDGEAIISQIACIIAENPDSFPTLEQVRAINKASGWSFDVRFPSHEYINATDWTRVQGIHIQDADLRAAWNEAERLRIELDKD